MGLAWAGAHGCLGRRIRYGCGTGRTKVLSAVSRRTRFVRLLLAGCGTALARSSAFCYGYGGGASMGGVAGCAGCMACMETPTAGQRPPYKRLWQRAEGVRPLEAR